MKCHHFFFFFSMTDTPFPLLDLFPELRWHIWQLLNYEELAKVKGTCTKLALETASLQVPRRLVPNNWDFRFNPTDGPRMARNLVNAIGAMGLGTLGYSQYGWMCGMAPFTHSVFGIDFVRNDYWVMIISVTSDFMTARYVKYVTDSWVSCSRHEAIEGLLAAAAIAAPETRSDDESS
jgi:hypothetical protein